MGKGFRERIKSREAELYNVFWRRATLILTIAFWRRQRIGKVLTYFEQVVVGNVGRATTRSINRQEWNGSVLRRTTLMITFLDTLTSLRDQKCPEAHDVREQIMQITSS